MFEIIVNIVTGTPYIIRIFIALFVILAVNRISGYLSIAVLSGSIILGLWSGFGFQELGFIALKRTISADNIFLLLIIFAVIWMSTQMSETGIMKDLVDSIRAQVSTRISMAILPAVLGLLPMPGGALFSAPLIDSCDDKKELEPILKTKVNYWFRHIWEYWWPVYPGVLLAIDFSGLPIWQFIAFQLPVTIAVVVTGYFFFLRRINPGRQSVNKPKEKFLTLIMPIIIIIFLYSVIRILIPFIYTFSKYLPMFIGIICAVILIQKQRPLSRKEWKDIFLSKKTANLVLIVALIRIYGAILEAELPGGNYIMDFVRMELDSVGFPTILVIMLIPFISGITTGLAVGFVGISFPIIITLLGKNPEFSVLISNVVLAYGFGYMGMILSPVHVCLIVTNKYFKTKLMHSLRKLLLPASVLMVFIVFYYLLISIVF
jgi:uncharacterized protein